MPEFPDDYRDLLEKPPRHGALATVGANGTPQVSQMGFAVLDGKIRMTTTADRQKVKNLIRNPLCSLLVVDSDNPLRTLEIRGSATVDPDPEWEQADRIAGLSGIPPGALRQRDEPEGKTRVLITVEPTRVRPFGGM